MTTNRTLRTATLLVAGLVLLTGCGGFRIWPENGFSMPWKRESAAERQAREDAERANTPDARTVALLLARADDALAANRLMDPPNDNAIDRYVQVLALDPGNMRARAGIAEISARYQRWAVGAAENGAMIEAERLYGLAALVDPNHADLAPTRTAINRAKAETEETVALSELELDIRSEALAVELGALGTRAKTEGYFVIINAPHAEWNRWIYHKVNEAPPNRRLRAPSEIGGPPRIQLLSYER